ncbi:hypothetical protein [Streptomyces sp. RerS4]|uniref:hypothetical protein n=1 Tax=Streptomyces sp. RerS4 TaxID=2942449 RepID=UPI00201BEF40|nr:hypothetical protein [Streptomyces sp. RerS4]UQX04681.1 hypothetical protein M4D82_32340 [Streptomyces sp. RerS4]
MLWKVHARRIVCGRFRRQRENPTHADSCTGIKPAAQTVFSNDDQPWNFHYDTGCRQYAYSLDPGETKSGLTVRSWI